MTKKQGKSEFRACGGGWESFRKKSVMNLEMCVESVADIARFTHSYEREPACNRKEFQSWQFHYMLISLYVQVTPLFPPEY
jgi:hypothetical protein